MAYKFQTLAARMSGSLTQEGDLLVFDHSNNEKASIGIDGHVSGSGALSAGGNLLTAGTVKFSAITADTALEVANDGLFFNDGRDGTVKSVNVGSFMADIAGDGLAAASNQLAVQVDDSTIETDSDALRLKDDGVTGAKLAPAVAGVGLGQDGSGNLDVQVSGAIHVASDKVSLTGSIAGDCLDKGATDGVDSIRTLHVVADETTIESAGRSSLRVKDGGIDADALAASVAGSGLTGGGGSALAVGAGSLIDVQADQVDVDLTEAAAATIANGDHLIFLDGGASGAASKGSTADLAALLDGSGLSRSNSTLSVAVSGAVHIASDKVSITGSITGDALDFVGGADSISAIHVVADESTIESAGRSSLQVKAAGITATQLATSVAGDGLTGGGGSALAVGAGSLIDVQANVVDVDLTEAAAATIADGDFLIFLDGGTSGAESKGSTADLATLFGGDGLSVSNSTLSVATSGSALTIVSDKLGISGSIAGDCLDSGPGDGVNSIRTLHVVADESTIESVGRETLRIKDDGVTGAKLAPAVAGAGLAQDGSGNLDVGAATNGGIAVNANDIGLDFNDLSAATVSVANDSIAIIDADDSNNTRKESIADLVSGIAGSGLSAASGVLSVQGNTVAARADGEALTEGYNVFADLSSNATVTLPSGSLGDVVVIKARNLTSGANIIVNPSGSQAIDGLTGAGAIRLESPFGAVTLVYAQANDWRIV